MYILPPHAEFIFIASQIATYLSRPTLSSEDCIDCMRLMREARDLEYLVFYIPQLSFCIDMESKLRMAKPDFNLIDYRLSDLELEQFDVWVESNKLTFPQVLAGFAEKSFKVSFTYVTNSNSWCISVTGQKEAKFNSGSTLTTWGEDCIEALYMAYFKVSEVFKFGVWQTKTQSRRG